MTSTVLTWTVIGHNSFPPARTKIHFRDYLDPCVHRRRGSGGAIWSRGNVLEKSGRQFSLAGGIDERLIQMLVFGGMNNENDFADLWILTLPSRIDLLRCTA